MEVESRNNLNWQDVSLLKVALIKDLITPKGCLIYNFQPILFDGNHQYCGIDMLVWALDALDDTELKSGTPMQLYVNGSTTEVCNATKGLLDVDCCTKKNSTT